MILPDYPIEDEKGDKLRRAPLARKVGNLIESFQGKESFVIGIEGAWGSGKTSFIKLALRQLENPNSVIVVHFNPWNFTGQNELITDFFASLLSALEREKSDSELAVILRSYASRLQVSFKPSIKLLGFEFSSGDEIRLKGKTLQQERDAIDQKLRLLPKKILVVIDDIDRLDGDETKLIMKLVKITANFPNTVFLLAYDRERVAKKLDGEAAEGDEYLKKIIQVSFTLPPPDEQELHQILFADLDDTIKSVYGTAQLEGENARRWQGVVHVGFARLFTTVRDIKRFISSLRLSWSIIDSSDVNPIDFIAIEAIRVFAPGFYATMLPNQTFFTRPTGMFHGREKIDEREVRFNELLNEVPEKIREQIRGITKSLFPRLDFTKEFGSDSQQQWRKNLRVCAEERFRFYLQLGIPKGSISENEVRSLLATLSSSEAFAERIRELSKEGRLRQMLSKVFDKVDQVDEAASKTLTLTLWNLEKDIADKRTAMFDAEDVDTQTTRIVFFAIRDAIPAERRVVILEELISASETLYAPARLVATIGQQYEKESGGTEPPLVSQDDVAKLKASIVRKIGEMASDGRLVTERNLPFLLYRWKDWGGDEPVRSFIKQLVSTRDGLVLFLRAFVGRVLSSSGDFDRLDKKIIDPLYPLSEIECLAAEITEPELARMNADSREAVRLFREPPSRDW